LGGVGGGGCGEHGEHLTIICLNGFFGVMVTWQTCLFFLFWGEEHDK